MTPPAGPNRILVVEDDGGIAAMLVRILSTQLDAEVTTCSSLTAAQSTLEPFDPDLVLLDLGLPDGDGITLCRDVRLFSAVPIIVLSALGDERRKVDALDSGADDFLVKPFSASELVARIRSVWRRLHAAQRTAPSVLQIGSLTIDAARHLATVGERRLDLTPKEFALLDSLARNGGQISTHADLLREVWGDGYADEIHYVRNVVKAIRSKLNDARADAAIINERGIGYRLEPVARG